jgi:hypothetical protein
MDVETDIIAYNMNVANIAPQANEVVHLNGRIANVLPDFDALEVGDGVLCEIISLAIAGRAVVAGAIV